MKFEVHPGETQSATPLSDPLAESFRGFGTLGVFATVVILLAGNYDFVPLGGLLVLVWKWRSGTPWREIGYVRPRSWAGCLVAAVAFGIVFKLVLKAAVMPLFGAEPVNQAFHYLTGNRAALPAAMFTVIFVAGFGEETVMRGYLFERLGKLFGTGFWPKALIVFITAGFFGLVHYPLQGIAGVQQATIVGIVHGVIFAVTGRIWFLIFSHAAFNAIALLIIYWDLESTVAHLIFK